MTTPFQQPFLTQAPSFRTTRWSKVIEPVQKQPPSEAPKAWEELYHQYSRPVYAYIRWYGRGPHDAQDLAQGFFVDLMKAGRLKNVSRDRGLFRAFLRTALKNFLENDRKRREAKKRGGGVEAVPLDGEMAERLNFAGSASSTAPDLLYDKEWGMSLLTIVMERLGKEEEARGEANEFEKLKRHLGAFRGQDPNPELPEEQPGTHGSADRQRMRRLRLRLRKIFREEVARTVTDPADVEDEMRAVIAAIRGD